MLSQKTSMFLILNYEPAAIHTTANIASLPIIATGSMDHEHPHHFRRQHRPWTPTRPQVAAQTTGTNTAFFNYSMDQQTTSTTTFEWSTDHRQEHGLRRHRRWRSFQEAQYRKQNHSLSWTSCHCSEPGQSMVWLSIECGGGQSL